MKPKILYIVIPCYNEQEVLSETAKRIRNKMTALIDAEQISMDSKVMFVNDGSRDSTWEIITKLHNEDKLFYGINLSRNRGHQNALLAGLMVAKEYADMIVSMDADLQDDINAIDEMVESIMQEMILYMVLEINVKRTHFLNGTTAEMFL